MSKNDAVVIGGLHAAPGQIVRGYVPVAKRLDGSNIGIPLVIICGAQNGPTLCVDASCHGDEHEGTMSALRLIRETRPAELNGTLVVVPTLNIPAVEAMQRGTPFDHWNSDMNRLYPGAEEGNLTQRIAAAHLQQIASQADYSISIHSGASYLYWSPQGVSTEHPGSVRLAQFLGEQWDIIWQQGGENAPLSGDSTGALNALGVDAITIEVGGAAERFGEAFNTNVDVIVGGIRNVMRHLGMLEGEATTARSWTLIRQRAVRSGNSGLFLPNRDVSLRSLLAAGEVFASLVNPLGEIIEEVTAPAEGYLMGLRTYQYYPAGWPLAWLGEVKGTLS